MMTTTKKKATGYYPSSFLSSFPPSPYPPPNQHNSANDVFPVKLYRLLEETTKNGHDDVISWSPDGMSFTVHDTERFAAEIMPSYFGSNKYRSFQKNLNMWSFKYTKRRGKCYHPLFRRGLPHLIRQMQRQLVKHQIERLQNKRELKTRKAAEIPKQRQYNEASMDTGLHSLQSSDSDVNHNKSVPAAYSSTATSIMDKVKREPRRKEQQSILSASFPLLSEIHKKIDEISLSQEQQQRFVHHHQILQARGLPPIDDNTIELHWRHGHFCDTEDSSGLYPTRSGDEMISLIISRLFLDTTTTRSICTEMRRHEGIADNSSVLFGNVNTANVVESHPPSYAVVDGLLSGLNGLSCLPAPPVANYVSTGAAESSPLLRSQLQDIFARKFLLQAYKKQGGTSTSTTRLDINNDTHNSSATRRNPSFSRLHHQEKERIRTLVPPVFLPQEQPKLHTIPSYGRSSSLSSSSALLPSYEDLLLQHLASINHQAAEPSINSTANSKNIAVAGSFCAPLPTAGSAFCAAAGISKAGQTRTVIANFIAAQKK